MILHSDFTPVAPTHRWLADLMSPSALAKDGAFARVVVRSDTSVVKATCCPATNLLFRELLHLTIMGFAVPHNLPAIFANHGPVLRDKENFVYEVWEVERLFEPTARGEQLLARVTGRQQLSSYKPRYLKQTARLTPKSLNSLTADLEAEQWRFRGYGNWEGSANIAAAMVSKTQGPLRDTFAFLHKFIVHHKISLDLLGNGNILVNMYGEPCLSDAVCPVFEGETPVNVSTESFCVLAEVPICVSGLQVSTQYRASPLLTAEKAKELTLACEALSLSPVTLPWNSEELLAKLASPPNSQTVWEFPLAARRLRENQYAKALGH